MSTTDCADAEAGLAWDAARCSAVATTLKALADPVRLGLFTAIAAAPDPVCVCALPDLGVSQPTVSHHLRKLREAGLLECERHGTWVHYRVSPAGAAVLPGLTAMAEATLPDGE